MQGKVFIEDWTNGKKHVSSNLRGTCVYKSTYIGKCKYLLRDRTRTNQWQLEMDAQNKN